jgi:hypothetical protein
MFGFEIWSYLQLGHNLAEFFLEIYIIQSAYNIFMYPLLSNIIVLSLQKKLSLTKSTKPFVSLNRPLGIFVSTPKSNSKRVDKNGWLNSRFSQPLK